MGESSVNNGVNVQALLDARKALSDAPEAAKFTWRASCTWQDGTFSKSTIQGFHGLGEEQQHKTQFSFDADHPAVFASEDRGATPVEMVLVGLASCLTAGVAAVAQHRGIQLRSVEANLEGTMDIQGILGVDSDVRNGYDGIKVTFNIDADASPHTGPVRTQVAPGPITFVGATWPLTFRLAPNLPAPPKRRPASE